jgi:hypothetical protein
LPSPQYVFVFVSVYQRVYVWECMCINFYLLFQLSTTF